MPILTSPLRMPAHTSGLARGVRFARWFFANLPHLAATRAPLAAWACYARTAIRRPGLERYGAAKERFMREALRSGQFGNDWFCGHIPYWLAAFEHYKLLDRPLQVLEIGSWEGLSSRFLLDTLPLAHLTCVDTWQGADEHQCMQLSDIEQHFDDNLARHAVRITKFKGTSLAFFAAQPTRPRFDLIYVDGSHHCDDVIVDVTKSFESLQVGGVMILDDYLWRYYAHRSDDPAAAINAFLRLKAGSYELFMVYAQVILRKKVARSTASREPAPAPGHGTPADPS